MEGETIARKSLTHIFMIMRDKAIQRKNIYQRDEAYSDRTALMEEEYMEMGVRNPQSNQLPAWAYHVEDVKYTINSILIEKIRKLSALQTNLIRRPSLDDNTEEEKQLNALASEIKLSLERCQSLMLQIKQHHCERRERVLKENVVRSLANSLQDIKNEFLRSCSAYTSTVNKIKQSSSFLHDTEDDFGIAGDSQKSLQERGWTQEQLLFLEDNTLLIEERDKSVQNILRSTLDLNQLFRDIAHLVTEQGTVVDQIENNIVQTSYKVHEGAQQLKKAEQHQRKNRKMYCIMGLAGTVVFFILLLVLTKF
ncbi:UNVERIFIED_CONTAM: hypothetical protein RMT77_015979 [Armadillidium vulgare]|nr:Syntaxin-16 [Armadillidium vulgare]